MPSDSLIELADLVPQFYARICAYKRGQVSLTGIKQDAYHLSVLARRARELAETSAPADAVDQAPHA